VNLGGVACRILWACFITIKNITPRRLRRLHLLAVKSLRPIILKGHLTSCAVHLGEQELLFYCAIIPSTAPFITQASVGSLDEFSQDFCDIKLFAAQI
jgi:hypothetical protein